MKEDTYHRFSDYSHKYPLEVPKRKYIDYKYKNNFASIFSVSH